MSELINNSEKRVETLAEIIKELHSGKDREAVKQKLSALVRQTTGEEIVAMEQKLISQGMSVNEIKGMCDLHSQILGDLVQEDLRARTTPGHPVHTFNLENEAILKITSAMRDTIRGLNEKTLDADLVSWRDLHDKLLEVDKHYAKKENVLFPHLERHGITGPSQVMWGKDDDIRVLMKSLRAALSKSGASFEELRVVADEIALPMLFQIDEMVKKANGLGIEILGFMPEDPCITEHDLMDIPITDIPDDSPCLKAVRDILEKQGFFHDAHRHEAAGTLR